MLTSLAHANRLLAFRMTKNTNGFDIGRKQHPGFCSMQERPWMRGAWLPAALRAAQTCQYLVYSEADFEVFRPSSVPNFTPSVQRQGCSTPKIEIFTQI